ncbi:MAG: hypothetical protein QW291_02025 [Thermofilaceae archaeon]
MGEALPAGGSASRLQMSEVVLLTEVFKVVPFANYVAPCLLVDPP